MATELILSVVVGVATTALYISLVWWLDRYEKEPLSLAAAVFFWGAIPAVVLSLVAELVLDVPLLVLGQGLAHEVISSSLIAPVVEEVVKAIALLGLLMFWRHEFDNVLDGIIYGALVGFGFAMVENVFYAFGSVADGSWGVVLPMRTLLFGLNHSFFTSLTGIGLGYSRLAGERWQRWLAPWLGLGAAITFHAVHNLGASLAELTCLTIVVSLVVDWGGVLVVVAIALFAARQESRVIAAELHAEIAAGILAQREYQVVGSYRQRMITRWRAWRARDRRAWRQWGRLFHLLTELAFKKHQRRRLGQDEGHTAMLARLRQEIVTLRREMGLIAPQVYCARCGTSLAHNDAFCRQCGQPTST